MFKQTFLLTSEDKRKIGEMCGKLITCILEGNAKFQMSDVVNLPPHEIDHNFDQMLYILRKEVGIKRYLKVLFRK